ncbi:phospholipid phosphatase 1-like [Dendronephthya gigantea]|uniref:phospholipid phosphatase 1-like n=1 Tax=Dendronephthya gigantea TaxID=151771 RepID=UPI00106DB920|nr:phospholipid phosphatase 1-like [Dendronephthya gigantea]
MAVNVPKAVIFNVVCLASLLIIVILFQGVGEPYHRGFFCDDESISKPFKDSTVSSTIAGVVGVLLPVFAILLIELPKFREMRKDRSKPFYKSHWFRWLCVVYICFLVGAAATVVLTDVGKYTVGRLRPHFLAVCKPDFAHLNCTTEFHRNFITDDVCTGDTDLIKEARLSFPSGHSSFAAFCMMFLVLYVDLRMTYFASVRLFKPAVEFALLLLAVLCGLSRVSDYKHHWSDVFAGLLLGTFFAFFFVLRILQLHRCSTDVRECQTSNDFVIRHSGDVERSGETADGIQSS